LLKFGRNFALLILVVAGITSSVQALPSGGIDIVYYDDITFSNVVGEHYIDCSGWHMDTGVKTQWYDSEGWACSNGSYQCLRTTCEHIDEYGVAYDCGWVNYTCWF
jgi:hypothetical protein